MEVHFGGIAEHLSAEALKKYLCPIMSTFGITEDGFHCEKFKKLKWANITFLERSQGQAFLQKHGQQHIPVKNHSGQGKKNRRVARLNLLGNDVFCSLSNNPKAAPTATPGDPDPIIVRGLEHATKERLNPTYKIQTDDSTHVFQVTSLSCGHNVFDGDRLVFIPDVEFQDTGIAKFSKRILLIKLDSKRVIRIPLDTIASLVCSFQRVLTLTLSEEPSFFVDCDDFLSSMMQKLGINPGVPGIGNPPTRTRICNLDEQHAKVVGQCLVYQLQVAGADLHKNIKALADHDVVPFVRYDLLTQRIPPIHLGQSSTAMAILMKELAHCTKKSTLPFGILFQLQALAWNAYLHPGTVFALTKKLQTVFRSDTAAGKPLISVGAMKMLSKQIEQSKPYGDASYFDISFIIHQLRNNEKTFRTDPAFRRDLLSPTQNSTLVYKITVTPSRITLHGPEIESMNRVLRKYFNHHEYFARVQFCDENGQDLFFNAKISYDKVYEKFKRVFNDGIQLAGRIYSFLGFSHSSLRSHSSWFCAPFTDDGKLWNAKNIIDGLGYFGHFRSPARCAARIGQAFSETPYSISLDNLGIKTIDIPDVVSPDLDRVFSDGVGMVSWDVIYHIWDIIPQSKRAPTAFQIRYKGSKGMLALNSDLEGSCVCIRPSMKKFESDDKEELEICDLASKPIPLVLNRQMIKILEDMGVDGAWFHKMQEIELEKLRQVTSSASNVAEFLNRQNVAEGIRLYRFFRQVENMGIDYRQDRFLRSVVEAVVLRELRLLKHKARIPIYEGVTLFGIMDETGFLQENEVYVTYDTMKGRFAPPPGECRVLVTRSPALHPGDIQYPKHVIPPDDHPLCEHSNVIVFSSYGDRDLPSQLSGGDLDGDIYNVIWDPEATPKTTYRPADYPRVSPLDLGRVVTSEDMAEFFIEFMKLDHLGVIATRHMILADQRAMGTLDPGCMQLAELHSTAVDFSKTGVPVDLMLLPKATSYRPDFLALGPEFHVVDKSRIELDDYIYKPAADEDEDQYTNPPHRYYESDKVLGHLYRAVNEQKIWNESIKLKVPKKEQTFWEQFLHQAHQRYEVLVDNASAWRDNIKTAREIRGLYEKAISEAMKQFSQHPVKPITEIEVFIGNILNRSGVQTSRQRDNSIKLRDEFDRISSWITNMMRKAEHIITGYETVHDNLHLCYSCVYVGGEEESGMQGAYYENMQSFRIVAACALLAELRVSEARHRGGGYVGLR